MCASPFARCWPERGETGFKNGQTALSLCSGKRAPGAQRGHPKSADPGAATGGLPALFKSLVLAPTLLNEVGAPVAADVDGLNRES